MAEAYSATMICLELHFQIQFSYGERVIAKSVSSIEVSLARSMHCSKSCPILFETDQCFKCADTR